MTQTITSNRYNVLDPNCPSRQVLTMLSDKWVSLIIVSLGYKQPQRNGELKRSLTDISQKMLTQTLRNMEELGLVARTVYDEVPPHVEYQLTPLGESLIPPIKAIKEWAEANAEVISLIQDQNARKQRSR
jgi:DNA-binding HxlR family transcriptional regulator